MKENMAKGDLPEINWAEFIGVLLMSASVGLVRVAIAVRKGRRFRWVDMIADPGMAVLGGMVVWLISEPVHALPDAMQAGLTSLGAWGGSRTLHMLEKKYLGGSRADDTEPGDLK